MLHIALESLTNPLAEDAATWLVHDPDGRTRLSFYGNHPAWWNLVSSDPNRYGFIAREHRDSVGLIDIELEIHTAYVAILVRAASRNRGVGRRLLDLAGDKARHLGARRLHGDIEADNTAALRCAAAAGFDVATTTERGLIHATLTL